MFIHLSQIRTFAFQAFKNSTDPNCANTLKLFVDIFKTFDLQSYYANDKTLRFVTEAISILYNLGIYFITKKRHLLKAIQFLPPQSPEQRLHQCSCPG